MTGFVYKWTNIINGRWYIGSHKGTTDDSYRHSSKSLAAAEKKYGQENFIREILFEGDYEKDDIKTVEAGYLNEYNAAINPLSYNQTNIVGLNCHSKESNLKRSKSLKGKKKAPFSKEHRKNLSISHKGIGKGRTYEEKYGVERSEEIREKASTSMKGKNLGKIHTAETKANLSEKASVPVMINGIIYKSRKEAANLLNLNRITIYRWLKKGKAKSL